jgi:hypothetical protein
MIFLAATGIYALVGVVTALAFVTNGVTKMLPRPVLVTFEARILLLPAAAALWPYVSFRWRHCGRRRLFIPSSCPE